jgi:hypothetical protein
MSHAQCPVCYAPLEERDVTPCFICGGWPEVVARLDPAGEFTKFRLPSDKLIVLCYACELEEFMVPGGWGDRLAPNQKLPRNALLPVESLSRPQLVRDKFCPACNLRLAFLMVIAGN